MEVVNLSFEEADQLKNPERLKAFISRYGLTYTVLLAGETEQLNEKVTQAVNLNCWAYFFLSRAGWASAGDSCGVCRTCESACP